MKIERDAFNSEIFGMNMGNIIFEDDSDSTYTIEDILEDAKKAGFQHLSVKLDISDKYVLNAFLHCGFELVDTQITYEIPLQINQRKKNTGITRPYDISDKERILDIAKRAYSIDRYHSDPNLPDERCDYYYKQWSKNLCEGLADKVFVIDMDERTSGFIALKSFNKNARVVLAAIDPRFQGNGFFTALMTDVICNLEENGFEYLYYGTQLGNIPVLRTVGRLNGVPKYSNHVLHKLM